MEETETMHVEIKGIAEKKSKKGEDYWSVQTSQGTMTVWDEDIASKLRLCFGQGQVAEVQVATNGNFKNIRGFNGVGEKNKTIKPSEFGKEVPKESKGLNPYEKDPVGLTIDVFACIIADQDIDKYEEAMDFAIKLVKKAKDAFSK